MFDFIVQKCGNITAIECMGMGKLCLWDRKDGSLTWLDVEIG